MNYRNYIRRIQKQIHETKSADRIQEGPWLEYVIKELNEISKECAKELQAETGGFWKKPDYILELHEAPPSRLFALEIALASWLGWIMHEKHGENNTFLSTNDCWKRLKEAYYFGVNLSKTHQAL